MSVWKQDLWEKCRIPQLVRILGKRKMSDRATTMGL